jgi:hypothetical protein
MGEAFGFDAFQKVKKLERFLDLRGLNFCKLLLGTTIISKRNKYIFNEKMLVGIREDGASVCISFVVK